MTRRCAHKRRYSRAAAIRAAAAALDAGEGVGDAP